MSTLEIPLTAEPQTFAIALGDTTYQLTLSYRDAVGGGWILDIADVDGAPLLCGVPLVTGADLLVQYRYMNFGGELNVQTDSDIDAVPTFDNLGTVSHVYFTAT